MSESKRKEEEKREISRTKQASWHERTKKFSLFRNLTSISNSLGTKKRKELKGEEEEGLLTTCVQRDDDDLTCCICRFDVVGCLSGAV